MAFAVPSGRAYLGHGEVCLDSERPKHMNSVMFHMTTVAVLAVLVVLILGLGTMLKGKSPNLSQTLMRWRVGLQFVAIVVIMVTVYFAR